MFARSADRAFRRFRTSGDPAALARVFDLTAPELLRLARHLASGEAGAEDLVQATFVTAIEAPEDHDGSRPVLPWLCGVLANHARVARRRAARVPDATRIAREAVTDPVDAAQDRELRSELARAIESLPEPYRPVLRLHLEHGFEPIEIARTLERPPGTVRAQIARGLEHLRRALPVGIGAGVALALTPSRGLAAVREAVLQHVGDPVGGLIATSASGVLVVMAAKVLLCAASLVCAAGVVWFVSSSDPVPVERAVVSADTDTARVVAIGEVPTPVGEPPERVGVEPPAVSLVDAAAIAGSESRVLELRIVRDLDGSPLVGSVVRLREFNGIHQLGDATAGRATDAKGVVRFAEPPSAAVAVNVDRMGTARVLQPPQSGTLRVEVRVPRGIDVIGRVVDPAGHPVANARVFAHGVFLEPDPIATTDAAGQFIVVDAVNQLALGADAAGFTPSLVHPITGHVGGEVRVELVLGAAGRRVQGRVLRPDGTPSPGALVMTLADGAQPPRNEGPYSAAVFARADVNGRFRFDAPARLGLTLAATPLSRAFDAPGRVRVEAGTADALVDITLRRGAVVSGTVRFPDKGPWGGQASAFPVTPDDDIGYLINMVGMRSASIAVEIQEDGTYELTGLVPGEYQLNMHSVSGRAQHTCRLDEGTTERWDVNFSASRSIVVRVEPGMPTVTDASVVILWWVRIFALAPDGSREFVNLQAVRPDGHAEFTGLGDKQYEIGLVLTGVGRRQSQTVASTGPVYAEGQEVLLRVPTEAMPAAHLTGRLLDAEGMPRANETLFARASQTSTIDSWSTITGEDGRFEFAPLRAADWHITTTDGSSAALATAEGLRSGERRDVGDLRER